MTMWLERTLFWPHLSHAILACQIPADVTAFVIVDIILP